MRMLEKIPPDVLLPECRVAVHQWITGMTIRRRIDVENGERDIVRPPLSAREIELNGRVALSFQVGRDHQRILNRGYSAGHRLIDGRGLRSGRRISGPDIRLLRGKCDGHIGLAVTGHIVGFR